MGQAMQKSGAQCPQRVGTGHLPCVADASDGFHNLD
jgi:hypothetical protein